MASPRTPASRKRSAREPLDNTPVSQRRKKSEVPAICMRCLSHVGQETEEECDGRFGPLGRNCTRCRKHKHKCHVVESTDLRALYGTVLAARETQASREAANASENRVASAISKVEEAEEALASGLKAFRSHAGKHIGDKKVEGMRAAGASGAGSSSLDALKLGELQKLTHIGVAMVEVGRAIAASLDADLSGVDSVWRMGTAGEEAAASSSSDVSSLAAEEEEPVGGEEESEEGDGEGGGDGEAMDEDGLPLAPGDEMFE